MASVAAAHAQDHGLDGINVDPLGAPDSQLEPLTWKNVEGWTNDDQAAAFAAFLTSCRPFLVRKRAPRDSRPIYNALWHVCRRAAADRTLASDRVKARAFFEKNFEPVRIAKLGESTGLLTGYYEPVVDGSRFPNPEFHTPLYRRPRDLVIESQPSPAANAPNASAPSANANTPNTNANSSSAKTAAPNVKPGATAKAAAGSTVPNRGVVGRLNADNKLEPYYDRGAIEAGALDGRKLEICWIREPFDLMNIQIQGSARVRLEDGTMLRIGYDAHNGYSYSAVGRVLIERNLVPREEMSMERIRQWMRANPQEAQEVRQTNKSYVFFRVTGLSDEAEPTGAQGVPLTPGRSIAVDKLHIYGTPFFIGASLPIESARARTKFRRLVIAQDTGSAITGPARADLYWGTGEAAAKVAGRIRQQATFVMLLPRELDMIAAGKAVPLPRKKPAIPVDTNANAIPGAAKESGKAPAAKAPGQETPAAKATTQDATKPVPAPPPAPAPAPIQVAPPAKSPTETKPPEPKTKSQRNS